MWYSWTSRQAFELWHSQIVAALNYPKVGNNAATGEPEPEKQQTTAYTAPVEVAADDWRAQVELWAAQDFPHGLGDPTTPPPAPETTQQWQLA